MAETYEKYLLVLKEQGTFSSRLYGELLNTGAFQISLSSLGVFLVMFHTILKPKKTAPDSSDWEAVLLNLRTKTVLAMENGEFYRLNQLKLYEDLLDLTSENQEWQHFRVSQEATPSKAEIKAYRDSVKSGMRHVDIRSGAKKLSLGDLNRMGWASSI